MGEKHLGGKDNVTSISDFLSKEDRAFRVDPAELDDAGFINMILSYITHPSVGLDPHRIANRLLNTLSSNENEESDTWKDRAQQISIKASELDDETYDEVAKDEIIQALITLIKSKNGHTEGNLDIIEASRVLIDFRTGVILRHREFQHDRRSEDRWVRSVRGLGRTATS